MTWRQRSNPWPALSDLFSALLIAMFAAFVIMSRVAASDRRLFEELADLGARQGVSVAEMKDLVTQAASAAKEADKARKAEERAREQLAAAKQELEDQEAENQQLQQKLENQQRAQARLDDKLRALTDEQRRGLDRPPCMLGEDGKVVPVVEVAIGDDGITVRRLPVPGFDRLVGEIPNLDALACGRALDVGRFRALADPILEYGKGTENVFGFECVFYAQVAIETDSLTQLSYLTAFVDDYFFFSNHGDVDRFVKNANH